MKCATCVFNILKVETKIFAVKNIPSYVVTLYLYRTMNIHMTRYPERLYTTSNWNYNNMFSIFFFGLDKNINGITKKLLQTRNQPQPNIQKKKK